MTRVGRLLAGVAAVAALTGCGGQAVVQVEVASGTSTVDKPGVDKPGSGSARPTLGPCEMYVGKPYVIGRDPDCGLTEEEKEAKQTAATDAFFTRLAAWFESDYVTSLDPATLPRVGSLGSSMPGGVTFAEAVQEADLAVLGAVETAKFEHGNLVSTFRVERTAKGRAVRSVTLRQEHGVRPGQDWKSAHLAVEESAPPLFPGDRAVLLLTEQKDGAYVIQAWSGAYVSKGGVVAGIEGNQFHDADGLTEAEFMDRIAAQVKG